MIRSLTMSLGIFTLALASTAVAAPAPAENAPSKAATAEVQREHSFEDLLVQGKYHFSEEAVTTVEDDKVLDALIGVRADFKDRLQESAEKR